MSRLKGLDDYLHPPDPPEPTEREEQLADLTDQMLSSLQEVEDGDLGVDELLEWLYEWREDARRWL